MWVPKWYFEEMIKHQNNLERRVKRLELLMMQEAQNKIASLSDEKAGSVKRDGELSVEEIIHKTINRRK